MKYVVLAHGPKPDQKEIKELIAYLKIVKDSKFDMSSYIDTHQVNPCETTACIAGCHMIMHLVKERKPIKNSIVWKNAFSFSMKKLKITMEQAENLFNGDRVNLDNVTKDIAIDTLKHLKKTGEVRFPTHCTYQD